MTQDDVAVEGELIRVVAQEPVTIRLYEVDALGSDSCLLTFRAKVRTELTEGRAFLEMWCRLAGKGEFFSKGFDHALVGHTDFATCDCPFLLRAGQKAELLKLNLVVEGRGAVQLKDLEILKAPLKN
mgnify:FL=1